MSHVMYSSKEAEALPTGTYLGMFHGRDNVADKLNGWGFNGPVIGPIAGYHVTYRDHGRIGFASVEEARKFFPNAQDDWVDLNFVEDCLEYEGKFYGDFTIFQHTQRP